MLPGWDIIFLVESLLTGDSKEDISSTMTMFSLQRLKTHLAQVFSGQALTPSTEIVSLLHFLSGDNSLKLSQASPTQKSLNSQENSPVPHFIINGSSGSCCLKSKFLKKNIKTPPLSTSNLSHWHWMKEQPNKKQPCRRTLKMSSFSTPDLNRSSALLCIFLLSITKYSKNDVTSVTLTILENTELHEEKDNREKSRNLDSCLVEKVDNSRSQRMRRNFQKL